jgi:hypothetical protein
MNWHLGHLFQLFPLAISITIMSSLAVSTLPRCLYAAQSAPRWAQKSRLHTFFFLIVGATWPPISIKKLESALHPNV